MARDQQSRRDRLSVDKIVECALALIDEDGLEAFSMRRLGTALRVDPMAIYHHIENKQAVVALVVDRVLAGVETPDPTAPWDEQIEVWARSYREIVTAHPALTIEAIVHPTTARPSALRATSALRSAMRRAGLTGTQVTSHADLVVDFVHGAALGAASVPRSDKNQHRRLQRSFEMGIATIIAGIRTQHRR